jgi:endonuclease YncB( thermonuclease family)
VAVARLCRLILFGVLATAGSVAGAVAQDRPSTSTSCRGEPAATGMVRAVIDGRSFVLHDGRDVRLAGVEVPLPGAPGETGARAAAGRAAKAALEAIVAGRAVALHQSGVDRYGRLLAQVFVTSDTGAGGNVIEHNVPQSVAHELLERGFARVAADAGDRACAAELLARERRARDAKLGLWSEPYYAIVGGEDGAELNAERGHFTVVEGKVLSVRESGGTIYMNFGRRWSQGLTVTILKRNERTFTAAGLDPRKLENRRVRVRGWIEERSGPRIEATHPEQIEIADRN